MPFHALQSLLKVGMFNLHVCLAWWRKGSTELNLFSYINFGKKENSCSLEVDKLRKCKAVGSVGAHIRSKSRRLLCVSEGAVMTSEQFHLMDSRKQRLYLLREPGRSTAALCVKAHSGYLGCERDYCCN